MEIKNIYKFVSMETEQALLGTLIIKNHKLPDLELSREDFGIPFHGEIYQEMLKQYGERQYFDVASLSPVFSDIEIDGIDCGEYISMLGECAMFDTDGYAAKILELSRKRKIQECLISCLHQGNNFSANEILDKLAGLTTDTIKTEITTHENTIEKIKQSLTEPRKCHSTGLKPIDESMGGGLYEGYTYGFCGAEKAGKTTMAHTISYNLGCNHLYVAMEMGSEQIEQRNIARDLGINSLAFLDRPMGLKEKIEQSKMKRNVFYLDAPSLSLDEIIMNITKARIKHGIKGFIIDYWQLVGGQQRGESEEKHLRTVAQGFADYARKNNLWCLLLAQMNSEGKLFGGNGLRKACDQLYMIHDCGEYSQHGRWLKQDASRYTIKQDVGSEETPMIFLETKVGPYFDG